jgi:hypothetical protein
MKFLLFVCLISVTFADSFDRLLDVLEEIELANSEETVDVNKKCKNLNRSKVRYCKETEEEGNTKNLCLGVLEQMDLLGCDGADSDLYQEMRTEVCKKVAGKPTKCAKDPKFWEKNCPKECEVESEVEPEPEEEDKCVTMGLCYAKSNYGTCCGNLGYLLEGRKQVCDELRKKKRWTCDASGNLVAPQPPAKDPCWSTSYARPNFKTCCANGGRAKPGRAKVCSIAYQQINNAKKRGEENEIAAAALASTLSEKLLASVLKTLIHPEEEVSYTNAW